MSLERDGHVLIIGLNRPDKRNAFNLAMLADLSRAYALLETDDALRVGCPFRARRTFHRRPGSRRRRPEHRSGALPFPEDGRDPLAAGRRLDQAGRRRGAGPVPDPGHRAPAGLRHPDRRRDNRFAQMEVQRGIYPFGGATFRFPRQSGWGNAMRWLLTGDEFGAEEAHRIGLIQEVAPMPPRRRQRALESRTPSPTGPHRWESRPSLASAHLARTNGDDAAIERLRPEVTRLFATADAAEGVQSFVERREARFQGR